MINSPKKAFVQLFNIKDNSSCSCKLDFASILSIKKRGQGHETVVPFIGLIDKLLKHVTKWFQVLFPISVKIIQIRSIKLGLKSIALTCALSRSSALEFKMQLRNLVFMCRNLSNLMQWSASILLKCGPSRIIAGSVCISHFKM